jgi:predicted glutamine amidotransferase
MCLLIYKKAGCTIPEEHLKEAFDNNSHGAGFTVRMFNEAGEPYLYRERGFFKFDHFLDSYRLFADCEGIVHFRLATAGLKNEENCHPFEVTPNVHMGHNGIINISQSLSKDHSDTWHFVEQVIRPIYLRDEARFWDDKQMHFLIDLAIGSSKLVFLHADGRYLIINEGAGHWNTENNIWYSNDSYEKPRYRSYSYSSPRSSYGTGYASYSYPDREPIGFGSSRVETTDCKSDKETPFLDDDYEGWPTSFEDASKKDLKRLARARRKLKTDDYLVDAAFRKGMTASEILEVASMSNGAEDLWDFVYDEDDLRYQSYL